MAKTGGWDGTYRRIDVHAHCRPYGELRYRGSGAAYVKRIRRQGVDAIALLGPGELCEKAVRRFGRDFILPVPMYYLSRFGEGDIRDDMQRWLDRGCRAVKFIAPVAPYSDPRYWHLYDLLRQRKALAIFHTGYLGFDEKAPENPPVRMTDMRAAHIDTVARRFPRLKILMSHFSNPWWEEAWKVSWSRPKVYADLSGGTAVRRSMRMWADTFAPDGELIADSLGKLCFATDVSYLHGGEHGIAGYIDFYERLFDRVGAPQRLRRRVLAGDAMKLFGIR